jgi:hypothetical protein
MRVWYGMKTSRARSKGDLLNSATCNKTNNKEGETMCEIYVTHRRFSEEFLGNLHYISERGRGFALIYENRVTLLRDLDAERVTRQYVHHARTCEPIITILHQRVPTHGDISIENTQPFASNKRVFAHNGMLSTETYHVLRAVFPNLKDASDSRLLWEVVKDLAWDDAVQLLRILGDRFVLADINSKRIALIGSGTPAEKYGIGDSSATAIFSLRTTHGD